jgi:hypothetical protein
LRSEIIEYRKENIEKRPKKQESGIKTKKVRNLKYEGRDWGPKTEVRRRKGYTGTMSGRNK